MSNSIYLIDYENVSYKGLYGISNVKPGDEIIIFYSKDISIIQDIIKIYEQSEIIIKYFQLDKTGKNALDFMISAYAGYAASKPDVEKIAVISSDKGYSPIITVIKEINQNVELLFECCIHNVIYPDNKTSISSTANDDIKSNASAAPLESSLTVSLIADDIKPKQVSAPLTKEYIKSYLLNQHDIPEKYINQVVSIISKSLANNDEAQFNNMIDNMFGQKSDNKIYKKIVKLNFEQLRKKYDKK